MKNVLKIDGAIFWQAASILSREESLPFLLLLKALPNPGLMQNFKKVWIPSRMVALTLLKILTAF